MGKSLKSSNVVRLESCRKAKSGKPYNFVIRPLRTSSYNLSTCMWTQLIRQFRHHLKLERSLSENSIAAYTLDVEKLADYASREFPGKSPIELELEHLRRFANALGQLEVSAYTQARIISGIKAFYRYLMYEDLIREDPSQLLEAPKLGRKLPDTLSYPRKLD